MNHTDLEPPTAWEEQIMWSWATFQESIVQPSQNDSIASIFGIVYRFMTLSSVIAPYIGDINDTWMDLALQLMFQSALEVPQHS